LEGPRGRPESVLVVPLKALQSTLPRDTENGLTRLVGEPVRLWGLVDQPDADGRAGVTEVGDVRGDGGKQLGQDSIGLCFRPEEVDDRLFGHNGGEGTRLPLGPLRGEVLLRVVDGDIDGGRGLGGGSFLRAKDW